MTYGNVIELNASDWPGKSRSYRFSKTVHYRLPAVYPVSPAWLLGKLGRWSVDLRHWEAADDNSSGLPCRLPPRPHSRLVARVHSFIHTLLAPQAGRSAKSLWTPLARRVQIAALPRAVSCCVVGDSAAEASCIRDRPRKRLPSPVGIS